jgi:hypothetical protein
MIGMGGSFNELTERESDAYYELDRLKQKLREYLRLGSCDGRVERKALRKELASLIRAEYDEKESRIK